jgi:signal transduction histidine kinase
MKIESITQLEDQLADTKESRQRVDLLNQLAWELYSNDVDRAQKLAEEARLLSTHGRFAKENYQTGLAESLHVLSRCEALLANYAVSISLGLEALEIFETNGDLVGQGRVYNALGITYLYMGNYPQALTTLLESLDVFEEIDDVEWQARQLNDLGYLHLEISEPEQALTYLLPGLELAETHSLIKVQGDLLNNVCNTYGEIGDFEKALDFGLKSINCYQMIQAKNGEAVALNSIGNIYQAQEDYQQALECHNKSLEIAEQVGYKFEIVQALLQLGRVYRLTDQQDESLRFFGRALSVAKEIDAPQKIYECHKELADVHKQLGNYQVSLDHFEEFQAVERSVFSSRADNRLKSLQVMHQLKDARHQAEISRLRNVELQRQIEARELLIADLEAFSHMVAHDLRNPLASVMMSIGMIDELKSNQLGEDGREFLRIARNMADRMGVIIRELLVLASVRQKDVTLVVINMAEITEDALDVLAYQIDQASAEITLPKKWPKVFGYPAWIEEIWVNYISNGLKYGGKPPKIELGYTRLEGGRVRFWVRDNGDGLTQAEQAKLFAKFSRLNRNDLPGYGLGLTIVQRIASKLDGEVGVESDGIPGQGSTFYFTLPGMIELE